MKSNTIPTRYEKMHLPFELKELSEEGTFEGWLSVYDAIDLGNDVVEPGAFEKTLKDTGGEVPCLWQHDTRSPIGKLLLEDKKKGLWVTGSLVQEVRQAKEAYALIKAGVVKGLSIGYRAVRAKRENGVRRLKEIKLYEGSVVTFPMLPLAQIEGVKDADKADFQTELERVQLMNARWMLLDALVRSIDSTVWDRELTSDEKIESIGESIDRFKESYLELLPRLFSALDMKVVPRDVSRKLADEEEKWSRPRLSDFTDESWEDLLDAEKRRIAGHFAWAESMPPEKFADLKLPHHSPSDGSVVWRGVNAAMGALMGSRGGVDLPDGERRAVYDHLVSHYSQFDREPPEFAGDIFKFRPNPRECAVALDAIERLKARIDDAGFQTDGEAEGTSEQDAAFASQDAEKATSPVNGPIDGYYDRIKTVLTKG